MLTRASSKAIPCIEIGTIDDVKAEIETLIATGQSVCRGTWWILTFFFF